MFEKRGHPMTSVSASAGIASTSLYRSMTISAIFNMSILSSDVPTSHGHSNAAPGQDIKDEEHVLDHGEVHLITSQ